MSKIGEAMPREYSDEFDKLRQNGVEMSFYKFGTAADNLCNALKSSHDMCVKKYEETGDREYLCGAANCLMLESMYPQKQGAYCTPVNELYKKGMRGGDRNGDRKEV